MTTLKEGDSAPDFSALKAGGGELKLSSLRGKNVVLYFFPKDDTPGCTIEANEFTRDAAKFASANTVVLGVSVDDVGCHNDFIKKYGLKVELLADQNQQIAKLYNSAGEKYAQRNTFVIDKTGKIRKIFWKVKPQGHAEEVLKALQS